MVTNKGILLCQAVEKEPLLTSAEMTAKWNPYAASITYKETMASDWLDTFESIEKNGAFYTIESEEKDNE